MRYSITPLRAINAIKLIASYALSGLLRRPLHWGMPLSASIEPTTHCNLHCVECPSGNGIFTRPQGSLTLNLYRQIIDQIAKTTAYLTLYFQGEPYLNKDFFEMVRYAKAKRIYVSTSTNAHFLTAENIVQTLDCGLDRLIVSLDGADAETYNKYRRNGDWNTVIDGINRLCMAKQKHPSGKKLEVVIQFIVFGTNEQQIPLIRRLVKQINGAKLQLKTAQIYHFENGSELIPKNKKYTRYLPQKDGHFRLKKQPKNRCWRLWSSCVFTWDGRVVPCCFDKDATYEMGKLPDESLKTIWNGIPFQNFRQQVISNRKRIPICCNCSE